MTLPIPSFLFSILYIHTHTAVFTYFPLYQDRNVRYRCCSSVSELSFRPLSTLACPLCASICQMQGGKLPPLHCAHPISKFAAECEMSRYHSVTAEDWRRVMWVVSDVSKATSHPRRPESFAFYRNCPSFVFNFMFVDTWRQQRLVSVIVVKLAALMSL